MTFHHTLSELLLPLSKQEAHTRLCFQPTGLSLLDVSLVIVLFLLRSILQSIGLRRSASPSDALVKPSTITLSMPLHLSRRHLTRYTNAVDPEQAHEVDLNNAQLLLFCSSMTEPAMLLLLAKSACPIRPLGAVNVRNRFELLRTDGKPSPLLGSQATVTASLHDAPRVVKRGLEYDIETTLSIPTPGTNEQVIVFRQVFTMLQFMKIGQPGLAPAPKNDDLFSSAVNMPVDVGIHEPSNWAALCKDYNPIHISSLLARAYGFSGKIAHGNHIVAKALHALTSKSSDTAHILSKINMPLWMEVSFIRPVTVPNQLQLRITQNDDYNTMAEFEMWQGGKICIEGTVGTLKK